MESNKRMPTDLYFKLFTEYMHCAGEDQQQTDDFIRKVDDAGGVERLVEAFKADLQNMENCIKGLFTLRIYSGQFPLGSVLCPLNDKTQLEDGIKKALNQELDWDCSHVYIDTRDHERIKRFESVSVHVKMRQDNSDQVYQIVIQRLNCVEV